ncbi:acetoin reductase family protein [Earliella scabrosa]|nr:acetoin reductase family protein [Earliella scabrosa]
MLATPWELHSAPCNLQPRMHYLGVPTRTHCAPPTLFALMDSTTQKRVAIITGAAVGIGRAIALRLAQDGLDLGLFDLPTSRDSLQALAEDIRKLHGARVVTVYGDVSIEDDVKRLVETVVHELGGLYAMVANAGIDIIHTLHEFPTETVDRMININIKGVFFSYKYAAIQLIKQGQGGRMIGAASIASKIGSPGQAIYCATKFAVRGMTQCAAMDYGKYGITVNAYAPGATETPLMDRLDDEQAAVNAQPKGAHKQKLAARGILKRLGQPEDVAKLVSFLASDDAAFITGQSYIVDGGICFD